MKNGMSRSVVLQSIKQMLADGKCIGIYDPKNEIDKLYSHEKLLRNPHCEENSSHE